MGKVIKSYAVQPVEEMILAALVIASAVFLEEFRKDRFVETDAEEAPVVKFAQSRAAQFAALSRDPADP